jgi:hypothetical protein
MRAAKVLVLAYLGRFSIALVIGQGAYETLKF